MAFFKNERHFLHKHLSFLESTDIYGKTAFIEWLSEKGISIQGEYWNVDHSTIDWNKANQHFQFYFDYDGAEAEIIHWLNQSALAQSEFLFTWLDWEDPVIKIKTSDFIANWEEFNLATGGQGLILATEDGNLFLEFTDDWKYHLNSNFEIKPDTNRTALFT
jgi:hypothetical protein